MNDREYYFNSYDAFHQSKGNKLTHYAGIPLILFSSFGILAKVQWQWLDLGLIAWLFTSIFYIRLDWKRAIPYSVFTFALYWFSQDIALNVHLVLFVVGWIFQGIGHYVYEKKSPAFLTNLSHLLIGPFWIFCRFWPVKD